MSNIPNISRFGIVSALESPNFAGEEIPPRGTISLEGAVTITDDAINDTTHVAFGSGGVSTSIVPLTYAADGPTYTVLVGSGDVTLSVRSLSAPLTIKMFPTPSVGAKVTIKAADSTFTDAHNIVVNGNGNDVEYEGAAASTFTMTPDSVGEGGSVTWTWDGTDWVSL
jgi:hypothetical protein